MAVATGSQADLSVRLSIRSFLVVLGAAFMLLGIMLKLRGMPLIGFGARHAIGFGLVLAAAGAALGQRCIQVRLVGILRLLLLIISSTLAIILAEFIAFRLYDSVAPAQGKRNIAVYLGELAPYAALSVRPHPYLLFENKPRYVADNGIVQTNSRGYRNARDYAEVPEASTLRVLTLGGSTTYGYMLDRPDDAWPSQLEKLLNEQVAKNRLPMYERVEVINGGLNFGTSAELLSHYYFRDRYLGASIVLIHTGGNDGVPMLFDDYNPEYTHFRPGWDGKPHRMRRGELGLVRHSHVFKLLYSVWLNDAPSEFYCNLNSKSLDGDPEYYVRNARANAPIGFERNLRLLMKTIQSDGALPILFPFVLSSDETFKNLRPEAAAKAAYTRNVREGFKIAIEKTREVTRSTAKGFNIPIVEIDADAIPTEYWLDHCHLSKDGESIKAKALAEFIEQTISKIPSRNLSAPGTKPETPLQFSERKELTGTEKPR